MPDRDVSSAAVDRDVEGFKDYLRDLLNQPSHLQHDVIIDPDDACSFIWVDVEGQCFWRVKIESVALKYGGSE